MVMMMMMMAVLCPKASLTLADNETSFPLPSLEIARGGQCSYLVAMVRFEPITLWLYDKNPTTASLHPYIF